MQQYNILCLHTFNENTLFNIRNKFRFKNKINNKIHLSILCVIKPIIRTLKLYECNK